MSGAISNALLIRDDARLVEVDVIDEAGVPIDITGATAFFTLNLQGSPVDDSGAAIAKTWTEHTDPVHGHTSVKLANADTQDLVPGNYYYDIKSSIPLATL